MLALNQKRYTQQSFSVTLAKKTAVRSCFLRNIAKSLILI